MQNKHFTGIPTAVRMLFLRRQEFTGSPLYLHIIPPLRRYCFAHERSGSGVMAV